MNSASGAVTPACPRCKRTIASDDVNVASDIAFCRPCNVSYKLSTLTHGAGLSANLDLANPPAGAWYRSDGIDTVFGATHRSVGTALGTLVFALFWNGIVSVFVLLALASTLKHLLGSVPPWFPAPSVEGDSMGVGMTIFLWIFLTPFIVIGLGMISAFLSRVIGRTEVRISNTEGVVFCGLGALGFRRRFVPSSVADVRIEDGAWHDSHGARQRRTRILVATREGKSIKFGSLLKEERRRFVAGALRRTLRIEG